MQADFERLPKSYQVRNKGGYSTNPQGRDAMLSVLQTHHPRRLPAASLHSLSTPTIPSQSKPCQIISSQLHEIVIILLSCFVTFGR